MTLSVYFKQFSYLNLGARFLRVATFLSLAFYASPSAAQNNVLFILDGSNSMWGQISGSSKMETAKRVLDSAVGDLGEGITPGLMVYGHRRKDDCSDVELMQPLGSATSSSIRGAISSISPRGKTPIANSLMASIGAFEGRFEENNNILLISDGIETCGGDPCAVAAELVARGINVRVNVVGFDVDAKARAQLQCIAEKGNGRYFDAADAGSFEAAIEEAKAVEPEPAPEPEPEPVKLEPEIYFEDHFNGDELDEIWELINPDPDNYLVESDVLTLVSRDGVSATQRTAHNVLRLGKGLPKGDWTITLRAHFEPTSMGEMLRVGIAKDEANMLLTSFGFSNYNYALTTVDLNAQKLSKGEATSFERNIFRIENRDRVVRARQFTDAIAAVELRLQKEGRNYTSAVRLIAADPAAENAVSDEWFAAQQLTSLRPPGNALVIIFGSKSNDYTPANGEGAVEVDWVKIETPPKE